MQDLSRIIITQLLGAVTVPSPKGKVYETPCRPSFALTFCQEGRITYFHRGQEYVSDRDHALILPRGAAYRLYRNEEGSFPLVNFQCEGLQEDPPGKSRELSAGLFPAEKQPAPSPGAGQSHEHPL